MTDPSAPEIPPDPFAGITPIGEPRALRLSRREERVRRDANHSTASGPATLDSTDRRTGRPKAPRRVRLKPTMSVEEALAMTEAMVRRHYALAMAPKEVRVMDADGTTRQVPSGVKEQDRKHASTSFGIAIDKWTMLSGRPTQIHELRGEERAGLKALALRVLQGGGSAS